jgi:hypothetical protein
MNLYDVQELERQIKVNTVSFNKGIMPQNKAADFAIKKAVDDTERCIYNAIIELGHQIFNLSFMRRLNIQGRKQGLFQSEKYRITGVTDVIVLSRDDPDPVEVAELEAELELEAQGELCGIALVKMRITLIEELIEELKRFDKVALEFNAHILEYAKTPEYSERRMTFLFEETQTQAQITVVEPTPPTKPPLKNIDELISQGYLSNDGHKVLKSLNDVAEYLAHNNVAVTKALLDEYFVKSNGEKYSGRALTNAVNMANTK